MDPTQQGASGSTEEGAAAILELMDAESPPIDEEQATEETDDSTQEGELEADSEGESEESEEEEGEAIESLAELVETNGWEIEDVLNLGIEVKVDGKTEQTTLSEALKNFQLESHLRNKDRELAEKMRSTSELTEKAQAQITERLSNLDTLVTTLENQLVEDVNSIDWKELKEYDPEQYLLKKEEMTERSNAIQEKRKAVENEQYQATVEYANKQREKLMSLPEFSTAEKFAEGTKAVAEYLRSQGFSDQEISGTVDHRAIQISLKAKKYDELMASKPQNEKKVKKLPKVLKPGAKQTKGQITSKQQQQKLSRLKKTGKTEDAQALMRDLL